MAAPIEDLYSRWKENPNAAQTLALCEALRVAERAELAKLASEIGQEATQQHGDNAQVLVATARMYMAARKWAEAQSTLVAAGKLAPREPTTYRWLGEVLLRRGDAERAEKVFERAVQFGADDPETSHWLLRARAMKPVQAKSGPSSVAAQVAASAPTSIPSGSTDHDKVTLREEAEAQLQRLGDEARGAKSKALPPSGAPGNARPRVQRASAGLSSPQIAAVRPKIAPVGKGKPAPTRAPVAAPDGTKKAADAFSLDEDETLARAKNAPDPAAAPLARLGAPVDPFGDDQDVTSQYGRGDAPPASAPSSFQMNDMSEIFVQPDGLARPRDEKGNGHDRKAVPKSLDPLASPAALPKLAHAAVSAVDNDDVDDSDETRMKPALSAQGLPLIAQPKPRTRTPPPPPAGSNNPPAPPMPPIGRPIDMGPPTPAIALSPAAPSPLEGVRARMPETRDVMDALTIVGIFDPAATTSATAWAHAEQPKRWKSIGFLASAVFAFFVVGGGLTRYLHTRRAEAHDRAEKILDQVDAQLRKGKAADLPAIQMELSSAFDQDSRSPRAALAWLRDRGLVVLLKGDPDIAFETAIQRAEDVGVSPENIAFARIAGFLAQGDTAGAASLLPKLDTASSNDAWYELFAGATLERAGDTHAAERYASAMRADPALLVAEESLARVVAMDGDITKAQTLASGFRMRYPDRPEGAAIAALVWGRDPARSDQAPPAVAEAVAQAPELPISLATVPYAVLALEALDRHILADARTNVQRGLSFANGPGYASWLGTIAVAAGDENLARKAALLAVQFSAVYPPARVLAARVALLGDRLDDALKATEDLDPTSPDVGAVRAAVAYERLDMDALGRAIDAVSAEGKKVPFFAPLSIAHLVLTAQAALTPEQILAMAQDDAPWSDVLAMDIALDAGDLDLAGQVADEWKQQDDAAGPDAVKPSSRPQRAMRLARLARYKNDQAGADVSSEAALNGGTVTARSLSERVYSFVARGKTHEVSLLLAKYPLVLGSRTAWLSAYATAAAGKVDDARAKIAALDPPLASEPVALRVIAASALGATKDVKRGMPYIKALLQSGIENGDVTTAGLALGFHWADRPGRKKPSLNAP